MEGSADQDHGVRHGVRYSCPECQERQTDTKCHTFLEPQARADLNDDGNVRNGRNVGNVSNAEISGMSGH